MKISLSYQWLLFGFGYLFIGIGLWNTAMDAYRRIELSYSTDPQIVLGNMNLLAIGIVALFASAGLDSLRKRLDGIENQVRLQIPK